MNEIRIGLAGLGRFGRLHARTLSELPGCKVRALCDVDDSSLEQCGKDFGVDALYTDLKSMLTTETLDAVDIVTDEPAHGEQVRLCLESGRAVFVEKPLAASSEEAREVTRLVEQSGLPVVVGNISRFDARYALLRRGVEAGTFGRVAMVQAKRNFSKAWFVGFGSRVHPVFESMIHDLDLMLWYLSAPVTRVYAQSFSTGQAAADVPDVITATLTADDGSIAVLQSTWLVPDGAPANLTGPPAGPLDLWGTIDAQIEIIGTAHRGRVDLMAGGVELWGDSHVRVPDTGLWPEVHGRVSGALKEELRHFLECVRTGKPSSITPPEEAARAVSLAEAIVRSTQEGSPVEVSEMEGVE